MKRLVTVVGAGALMLVLGACGQAQQSSSTPTQVEPANGIAHGTDRPVPEDQIGATRLRPSGMRRAAIGIGMLALLATACGANTQVANAGNTASPTTSVSTTTTTPPPSAPTTTTTPPKVSTGPAVPPSQVDYSQLPD